MRSCGTSRSRLIHDCRNPKRAVAVPPFIAGYWAPNCAHHFYHSIGASAFGGGGGRI